MSKVNRYQRQLQLKSFGKQGQDKLASARVLVIGAGGLGCPALQYLAGAGVGTLGIVDFDTISLTNLHRQPLYTTTDVGRLKVEVAAEKLRALNPEIIIQKHDIQLTNQNALEIIEKYDLVIDGTDNFSTRYMINDACVILNKPLIYGAVMRFEGQVGVFNLELDALKTNYRDLFPNPPDAVSSPSCNEVGVLGVLPGIIGTWQASEAIKVITGIGESLANKILTINLLDNSIYEFQITQNSENQKSRPQNAKAFYEFKYNWFCNPFSENVISCDDFEHVRKQSSCTIIDVREPDESPFISEFETHHIPMSQFSESILNVIFRETVVVLCQSGHRSIKALELLKEKHPTQKAFSLEGGILEWKKRNQIKKV